MGAERAAEHSLEIRNFSRRRSTSTARRMRCSAGSTWTSSLASSCDRRRERLGQDDASAHHCGGLETADAGSVAVSGRYVSGVGDERGMVFQEPRLLPWLTVAKNVSIGLELRGLSARGHPRVGRSRSFSTWSACSTSQRPIPASSPAAWRSGVGIARALAISPQVMLLDEPLGALDAMTKMRMQRELERLWQEQRVTMIMVTHDTEGEAVYLADKVVVMASGQGGISEVIPVPLPRPRDRSAAAFAKVREALLRVFNLSTH